MAAAKEPFLTYKPAKILAFAGLTLLVAGGIGRMLFYFESPMLAGTGNVALMLMSGGIVAQLTSDFKMGKKEKLREAGFRLLLMLAAVGVLAIGSKIFQ